MALLLPAVSESAAPAVVDAGDAEALPKKRVQKNIADKSMAFE